LYFCGNWKRSILEHWIFVPKSDQRTTGWKTVTLFTVQMKIGDRTQVCSTTFHEHPVILSTLVRLLDSSIVILGTRDRVVCWGTALQASSLLPFPMM
jgi:hypothetical protein